MAATPEVLTKRRIRKLLDEFGVYYAMPIGTGYGNSGVPDFLCCYCGHFIAIEAKAPKGQTTALQESHLRRIKECGGIAMVVRDENMDELRSLLCRLKEIGESLN